MTQPTPAVVAAARASAAKWKIPASISLAQWALESSWGKSMPPGSKNPFGIKATGGQPSVTVPTREVIRGKSVIINAAFRKFASLEDAFEQHAKLLATGSAYAAFRAALPDIAKAADALGGGTPARPRYATDPLYGSKLRAIINGSNLKAYDA
jgi:flagellum-specific peptidoglycan hydrolase FlgJ